MELNLKSDAGVVTLITEGIAFAASAAQRMHEAAKLAAEKHVGVSAKVIATIYADSIKHSDSRVQSNARQQFASSLVCFLNASTRVEVAPPKDGKAATFKEAGELTAGEAKRLAAQVREAADIAAKKAAIEAMTGEEKAAAQAAAEKAAEEAKLAAAKAKAAAEFAADKEVIKAFAARWGAISASNELLDGLRAAFALQGLKITVAKDKSAPKPDSLAAQASK